MWHNHDRLREQGVLLPGRRRGDHALASFAVREDRGTSGRPNAAPEAWERILADVAAWPGTAVISHEFFGAATAEQASRAIDSLRPADVHLVVTARDALSAFTA